MTTGHVVQTRVSHAAVAIADANPCVNLIRKLRWIGLDEEACRLEKALSRLAPDQRGTVVAEPRITD